MAYLGEKLTFQYRIGAIETSASVHLAAIWMSFGFVGDQVVFLHINIVPVDAGGYDWHTKIIRLYFHTS